MDYNETIDFLFSQLPMFQRTGKAAYKNNLDNTLILDKHFKSPHCNFKTIHVGGTNGKGSVSHSIASILQESGLKVGLYTSPHLRDFRERIKIDGEEIPESEIINFVSENKELIKTIQASFFEMTVAMAFNYFSKQKVDIAIIEVGLGGRLDSTNIINPEISVITNISLDHTNLLGNNISDIAKEKAGIIKANTPIIIGEHQEDIEDIFIKKAKSLNSKIMFANKDYSLSKDIISNEFRNIDINKHHEKYISNIELILLGSYQKKNILTAISTIDTLIEKGYNIKVEHIRSGLKKIVENTGLLGRWQTLQNKPKVICDTGHNEAGIKEIIAQLKIEKYKQLRIVFGMVNDKDVDKILNMMPKNAIYTFVKANIPRAMDAFTLQEKALKFSLKGNVCENINEALKKNIQESDVEDLIFVGGSTFVVAEIV